MRERASAEPAREALADVGEGCATAELACRNFGTKGKDRHVLAGVVATLPSGIAAVIGGDDRDIVRPKESLERR